MTLEQDGFAFKRRLDSPEPKRLVIRRCCRDARLMLSSRSGLALKSHGTRGEGRPGPVSYQYDNERTLAGARRMAPNMLSFAMLAAERPSATSQRFATLIG